eukprot:jgi/Mesen1/4229/ME000022S03516
MSASGTLRLCTIAREAAGDTPRPAEVVRSLPLVIIWGSFSGLAPAPRLAYAQYGIQAAPMYEEGTKGHRKFTD